MSFRSGSGESPPAVAIIVAAGAGRRMGGGIAKQFLEIDGEPVLSRAMRPFLDHPAIDGVVVVLPPANAANPPDWLQRSGATVIAGGTERGDSVWNGLQAAPDASQLVLIHDGARPFVTAEIIDRVLDAARSGAAVAGLPASDTIKEVGEDRHVRRTLDRSRLWLAQTPQGFTREVIVEAYRRARELGITATDDATLCEELGTPVVMVVGSPDNLKITRPEDMVIAKALSALRPRI